MAGMTGTDLAASVEAGPGRRKLGSLELLIALVVVAFAGQHYFLRWFDHPSVKAWTTVFVAVTVQAMPFLVLGVLISGAIAAFVPATFFARALPRRHSLAVPVAGLAGVMLPGCECASVPISQRLISRGVPPAAALTFLLSAPAINPVVLVATAVAFPGQPQVVLARFLASLLAAVAVGWIWARFARADVIATGQAGHEHDHSGLFSVAVRHDFLQAGGFLVIGAVTSATLNTVVPRDALNSVAHHAWLAVPGLAVLAVVLAVCSEADAFIASSLTQFSLTARLTFMVVGPMVDIKLIIMQAGAFGRRFATRFAPLALAAGVASSVVIGMWLL
jgi:uncharacterized membrane protein YraQ (UPF0718 family)